jgi:enoyl-CoA hydratase/carnithine racemase
MAIRKAGSPGALHGKRVLVVDDEPDVLTLVQAFLGQEGCEVQGVTTNARAHELLETQTFDFAILDLMGVNGIEILDSFQSRLPCLVLTAHAVSAEMLRQVIEHGAVAYVPKDEIHDLPRYLRILLSQPRGMSLWPVWLHPRLDPMKLRLHLGADFERVDPAFFEEVAAGARSHEQVVDIVEHEGGIVEVRHREPPLNFYSASTILFYHRFLQRLRRNDDVRAVIQSSALPPGLPPEAVDQAAKRLKFFPAGVARAAAKGILRLVRPRLWRTVFFGAGIPLDATLDPVLLTAILEFGKNLFLEIFHFPKPYVIAVEGPAVAGAFEGVLCAHFVVADQNALFWLPEFRLGFAPPAGIPLLINRVGIQRAFTIAAEARPIAVREAARLGIVDRVVRVGEARRTAADIARSLANRQAVSGLELARELTGFSMREALDRSFAEWQRLIETPVAQERVEAFFRARGREVRRRA